ncbi:MAG: glycosyltransferase family 4 protein [Bacteroidota bacterium]
MQTDVAAPSQKRAGPFRILVIFGNIPLWGQERGNIQALYALKEAGHSVLFVTHRRYGHESIQPALDELGLAWTTGRYPKRFARGMTLKQWRGRLRQAMRGSKDFLRVAREFQPTHIHVGNEGYLLNLLPVLWALRIPIVFRVGDAPRQHRPLFRFVWRYLIVPSVSRFVPISKYIRERLCAVGVPEDSLQVIYSYPPQHVSSPSVLPTVAPFKGRTVFYVGQLSKLKGLDVLVEAALGLCSTREDVRFIIAGDYAWKNSFAEDLMRRVEEAGLSDRIQFLGFVEEVQDLFSVSDIHVAPSVFEEPLGNVILEAKQAGVPSVVFPSGGMPELLSHRRDGWICRAKTAASLAEGIEGLLDLDETSLDGMKKAAEASLERLGITPEAFTRAWEETYASV